MRKKYELTVIYNENENDRKQGMAHLEELFEKHGVKVQTKDEMGVRLLAYEIADNQKGFYVFYIIDADNMSIDKLSADMRLSTSFLRFLIVRKDELTSDQKARKDKKIAKIKEHLAKKIAYANEAAAAQEASQQTEEGESK